MMDFSKSCSVILATLLLIGCNPDESLVDSGIGGETGSAAGGVDTNYAPTVYSEYHSLHSGDSVTFTFSTFDANDDDLTFEIVSDVTHGFFTINSGDQYTYTCDATYDGYDYLEYRAYDGQEYSSSASITFYCYQDYVDPSSCEDATATEITTLGASTIKYTFGENACIGKNSSYYSMTTIPVTNIGASGNAIELVSDLGIGSDAYLSIAATNSGATTLCDITLAEMRIYDPSDELILTFGSNRLIGSTEIYGDYESSDCLRADEIGYFLDIDTGLDFPNDMTGWYAEITEISSVEKEADTITSFTGVDLTSTDSTASARFQLNGGLGRDLGNYPRFVYLDEDDQPIGWTFGSPNIYSVIMDQLEIGIIADRYGFSGLAKSVVLLIDYDVTTATVSESLGVSTSLGLRSGQIFKSQKERDMAIKEELNNRE